MKILSREKSNFISEAEVWLVHSDIVDDDFRICISAPFRPLTSDARAGVIYGTDGGLMAGMLTSIARTCEMQGELPQLYTVSIGYPLDYPLSEMLIRNRDLTPSASPDTDPALCTLWGADTIVPSGGGDKFLAFLVDELRPALNAAFPIDADDATLMGASLGGLFTVHALLSRPEAFRHYLAMCPALWWDDKAVVRAAKSRRASAAAPDARLYMCAGEFESVQHYRAILEGLLAEQRSALPREMLDADVHGDMFAVEQALAGWGSGFAARAKVQPEESHGSVTAVGLSQGLRWLFGSLKR